MPKAILALASLTLLVACEMPMMGGGAVDTIDAEDAEAIESPPPSGLIVAP